MRRDLETRVKNTISMAQRAGFMASGAFAVDKAFAEGRIFFLLIAEDAEAETKRKYKEIAEKNHVPCEQCMSREVLGHILGKEYRAVAGILDEGFAKSLKKIMEERRME